MSSPSALQNLSLSCLQRDEVTKPDLFHVTIVNFLATPHPLHPAASCCMWGSYFDRSDKKHGQRRFKYLLVGNNCMQMCVCVCEFYICVHL